MFWRGPVLVLLLIFTSCKAGDATTSSSSSPPSSSCWDYMGTIGRIRKFTSLVASGAPSVQRKLALSEFKFTIFAYSNEAYDQAIASGIDADFFSQSDTIKYHIYGGGLDSSNRIEIGDFYWRDIDQTLLSVPVFASQMVESDPTEQYETLYYYVNGARVVDSWTNSSACFVYALDRVLLPLGKPQTLYGFLQSTENNLSMLNDLVDVVAASDPSILATLKELRLGTAFMPTDDAFQKLGTDEFERIKGSPAEAKKTLLAHFSFSAAYFTGKMKQDTLYPMEYSVVQGIRDSKSQSNFISYNGFRVKLTHADITLSNGVVHLIDSVLAPPNDDLVASMAKLENLSKFASLVAADAAVVEMLNSSTRYTVFAPIDGAVGDVTRFRSNAETLDGLVKGLIVRGQFATSNLKQLASVDESALPLASSLITVSGAKLNIVKIHNDLFVSDGSSMARIIRGYSDIAAANGIVHYIDAFIGRPSRSIFDTIGSFGPNLNSTAYSLRQLGFSATLGTSAVSTKSPSGMQHKNWWVMFVPIESSWPTLRQKKGAAALLRNRLAMARVWQRHMFYAAKTNNDLDNNDDTVEKQSGFIRRENLATINDLLVSANNDSSDDAIVTETSRNSFQLKFGEDTYKILYSNIGCSNGVIHIIDRLILVKNDPIAELNIGNPRILGAQVVIANQKSSGGGENVSHLTVSFDDYGSTVDSFASSGPIDLTRAESASISFTVDCGEFQSVGNEPLPAFSFVVPEWDLSLATTIFARNDSTLAGSSRKIYTYNFSKNQLATAGICEATVNPVASSLPGHHQGRAYFKFSFQYGPVILSIKANSTSRGCLFTCNVVACPANKNVRVLWAFSADASAVADESSDEAYSLGNVATNDRQFYLDAATCSQMLSGATKDLSLRRSLSIGCRATTFTENNNNGQVDSTKTAVANFFDVISHGQSQN